ncbi:hypothetical protein CLOM_g22613 [Closterium sp. NIES-68]|nr:hypothetical protein CLOM_g22613 [Closterium sp. NIES-68]GJP76194.1 hypothetical protein CLOP_g6563 [Closterium sp. NIES-67]
MSDPPFHARPTAWQRLASRGMRAWLGGGAAGRGKSGAERRMGGEAGGTGRGERVVAMAERSGEYAEEDALDGGRAAADGRQGGAEGGDREKRTGERGGDVAAQARRKEGVWRWGEKVAVGAEREGLMGGGGGGGEGQGLRRQEYERLFSTLNEANTGHEPGDLLSSTLLVAGTTVGAGILALPAVTSEAGFLPSSATCIVCWLYMVATGMLIAEVNVNTMCELGSGGVSLVSMAERTLGTAGVRIAATTYLLIHYAVITAYVSRSADIISSVATVPHGVAASLFTLSFGALCYFGSQRAIGLVNGLLVGGIVLSFGFLLAFSLADIHPQALLAANLAAVPASVPIIALSFVYQNVVPVVATNLEGNLSRIRTAILAGTALPLVMFLLWDAAILGTAPLPPTPQPLTDALAMGSTAAAAAPAAAAAAVETMSAVDPLVRLQQIDPSVGGAVQLFSFFAIATSYIGFILGLSDFLADALKLPSGRGRTPLPYILTLAPPLAFSLSNPDLFFTALDLAGTYGVLVLFGILPAAMAWVDRSSLRLSTDQPRLVPGGNVTLTLIIGFALTVIMNEFLSNFIH